MAPELEIVPSAEGYHVLDRRGVLLMAVLTRAEAETYRAGYRTGWTDAGALVRPSADRLAAVGRSL